MSTLDEQIGIRLKIARKSFGWKTATAFCDAVCIPKSTYSQYEKGHRNFTVESCIKYSKLLDIELNWLLTGQGHPCPKSKDGRERKQFIETEVKKFHAKRELPSINKSQASVESGYISVNGELFLRIVMATVNAIDSKKQLYNGKEFMEFCLDLYNNIEPLNLPVAEIDNLIHLSINSALKGSKSSFIINAVSARAAVYLKNSIRLNGLLKSFLKIDIDPIYWVKFHKQTQYIVFILLLHRGTFMTTGKKPASLAGKGLKNKLTPKNQKKIDASDLAQAKRTKKKAKK
jgi:transcriptional regulator with XRE-family HTH domain